MRICTSASVALVLFTLVGCGDKSADPGGDKSADPIGDLVLAKKIVGKWKLDVPATRAAYDKLGKSSAADYIVEKTEGNIFEYKGDGTATLQLQGTGSKAKGTWKATGESGDTVTFEFTLAGDETLQATWQFLSDDQARVGGKSEGTIMMRVD